MRNGTWSKTKIMVRAAKANLNFLINQIGLLMQEVLVIWKKGLKKIGFDENDVNDILGNNWFNFYKGIN